MTGQRSEEVPADTRWSVHLYEPACDPGGAEFVDNVVAPTREEAITIVAHRATERWPGVQFAVWRAERASDASGHFGGQFQGGDGA